MAEKEEYYVKETSYMQKKIEDYVAQFPADIKEEDGILLASAMENSMDMKASSVGLGTKEFVAAMDGRSQSDIEEQQEAADASENQEDTTTPVLYRTQDDLQIDRKSVV